MAEHLTPEKIEALRAIFADPEATNTEKVFDLILAAPALLAAAELGMAWEAEAMASRPFIDMNRIKVWSDAEGLPGLAQHNRYMAARATTDQLTGRIGG